MNQTWQEELEEHGQLHSEGCDVNDEGGSFDGCHCENMQIIKGFVQRQLDERDRYWVEHLQAHRPYCTTQGNKELTKIKRVVLGDSPKGESHAGTN